MCCKDSANEGNDKEKACLFLRAFPSAAYLLADRQSLFISTSTLARSIRT